MSSDGQGRLKITFEYGLNYKMFEVRDRRAAEKIRQGGKKLTPELELLLKSDGHDPKTLLKGRWSFAESCLLHDLPVFAYGCHKNGAITNDGDHYFVSDGGKKGLLQLLRHNVRYLKIVVTVILLVEAGFVTYFMLYGTALS